MVLYIAPMEKTLEQKWKDLMSELTPEEFAVLTDRALRSALVMQELIAEHRISEDEPSYGPIKSWTYKTLASLL